LVLNKQYNIMAKKKQVEEDVVEANEAHQEPMQEAAPVVRKKDEAINGVKLKDPAHALPQEEIEHEMVKVKAKNPAHLKPQE